MTQGDVQKTARVAKLVDAPGLGPDASNGVGVRVPPRAPLSIFSLVLRFITESLKFCSIPLFSMLVREFEVCRVWFLRTDFT
jgi:hypothetical protein